MSNKEEKTYFFSVEGKTEKYYLKRIEKLINENPQSKYKVYFDILVTSQPLKRINSLPKNEKNIVYHLCDIESNEPYHQKLFQSIIDGLSMAKKKDHIKDYELGYSNQTFELWILLHKTDSFAPNVHRRNYHREISKAFNKKFRGNQDYKRKEVFNKLLLDISLEDVKKAINREKSIMKRNQNLDYQLFEYKGYNYYKNNPSLTVGNIIEKILLENGLI